MGERGIHSLPHVRNGVRSRGGGWRVLATPGWHSERASREVSARTPVGAWGRRRPGRKACSMMRQRLILWGSAGALLGLVATLVLATAQPAAVVLRFTDMAVLPSPPVPVSP